MNRSLRTLGVLCVSAVSTVGKPHRRGAESAEIAQRVETRTPPIVTDRRPHEGACPVNVLVVTTARARLSLFSLDTDGTADAGLSGNKSQAFDFEAEDRR